MANGASVRSGLSGLVQAYFSDVLIDNTVDQMVLLALILGKDGNKEPGKSAGLGRPGTGAVVSGVPMPKVRRQSLIGTDKYQPIVVTTTPSASDGKVMGNYDTVPTTADWATNSPASAVQRPVFKWCERADPILVPKKEIDRTMAGGQVNAARAVGDLVTFQSEQVLKTHLTWWNSKLYGAYTVAPTSQDADVWDSPFSLAAAIHGTNTYAQVDKSLTANTYWRGNFVSSTTAANLIDLVDYANYGTPKIAAKGRGIEVLVCGLTLWPVFKAQARAHGSIVYNDKIPELGNIGFKRELVRYGNTFVICDPTCPSTTNGDATNYVYGLDLSTWTVAFSAKKNFAVGKFMDLSETTETGKDALKATLRTEAIIACEAPSRNIVWTDVA